MCSMFPFRDSMVDLLARRDQVRWLAEDGGRRVGDIVHRTFETVDAAKPLDTAFSRRQQHPDEPLRVTGRDRFVGFGGLDEITNLLRIK
jgi:hypothetical protein